MRTPALSVRNLVCDLDGRRVLNGVDLEVGPGELVGLIGANGAGKSTLLRAAAGLIPAAGAVQVAGRPLGELTPKARARSLALMHQHTELTFPFPARDVVLMGRYAHQGRFAAESEADRRAVDRSLALTGTGALAAQPVTKMSGGERQRVFLAQALAQETPLLLLDEPTSSLDLGFQEQIFGCVRQLVRDGKAVLAAIHDLRSAARTCDRLALLAGGRILVCGPPEEVLTPENLSRAYGVSVRVYRNPISGLFDYHFWDPGQETRRRHVHVIGGGGAAAGLLRVLGDGGYRVTVGVLAPGDSDLAVAAAYGMPVLTCLPFSGIGDGAFADNGDLARQADLTVVANLPFGPQNLRNLESALGARNLVLIEEGPPEARDFTGGEGLVLYRRLRARATVLTEAQFAGWLGGWAAALP